MEKKQQLSKMKNELVRLNIKLDLGSKLKIFHENTSKFKLETVTNIYIPGNESVNDYKIERL